MADVAPAYTKPDGLQPGTVSQYGLNTPEPDDARLEAENVRLAKQAELMRQNILGTSTPGTSPEPSANNEDPLDDEDEGKKGPTKEAKEVIGKLLAQKENIWQILGVAENSKDDTKTLNAFTELGCLLHPEYVSGRDTGTAFASKLGE